MKTVYKYELEITDEQQIAMPIDAEILCVQLQHGVPCLWVRVDPNNKPTVYRVIRIHGTGHPIDHGLPYIGTFQVKGGILVFHVFG